MLASSPVLKILFQEPLLVENISTFPSTGFANMLGIADLWRTNTRTPLILTETNSEMPLPLFLIFKRVVPKGLDHTLSVITITLYVCVCAQKWSQPGGGLGVGTTFSENRHILLLTKIQSLAQSIKRAVAVGKVHLPIKSIKKMFIFGPYLGN